MSRTRLCAAPGCKRHIDAETYLMCRQHWFALPQGIRDGIWHEYRFGMRRGTHPTQLYWSYFRAAVKALESKQENLFA